MSDIFPQWVMDSILTCHRCGARLSDVEEICACSPLLRWAEAQAATGDAITFEWTAQ